MLLVLVGYLLWAVLQLGHGAEAVETFPRIVRFASLRTLQLGHGAEAVETGILRGEALHRGRTSIRPRR